MYTFIKFIYIKQPINNTHEHNNHNTGFGPRCGPYEDWVPDSGQQGVWGLHRRQPHEAARSPQPAEQPEGKKEGTVRPVR